MLNYEYTVAVNEGGGINLTPTDPSDTISRAATIFDIIDSARKLVADLERQVTFDGISQMLESLAPQEQQTQQDIIAEALARRSEETPEPVAAADHVAVAEPVIDIVVDES